MTYKLLITSLITLSASLCFAEAEIVDEKPRLSQLATESALVAVVQVVATEYEYTRGFPSKGFATLRILIPYKLPEKLDQVQVFEEGLKASKCYFPPVSAWQRSVVWR